MLLSACDEFGLRVVEVAEFCFSLVDSFEFSVYFQ